MLGFLRYGVQLLQHDITLEMIVAICFPSVVKPHAVPRNSGHIFPDVFYVPFIIVKRNPILKFKNTENMRKETKIIPDLSRNEGKMIPSFSFQCYKNKKMWFEIAHELKTQN